MVGLIFSSAFDRVNNEFLISKFRQLSLGGVFLSILIEFLTDRVQRIIDGHYSAWKNIISGVPHGNVFGPLLYILYTQNTWYRLEHMLVTYEGNVSLLAVVPSSDMRSVILDLLNRDLAMISEWCRLWAMKMHPSKTQSMIVSRSRTLQPQHLDLFIDNVPLTTSDSFKILGINFDTKSTSELHLRSVSSVIAQKFGLLRKP